LRDSAAAVNSNQALDHGKKNEEIDKNLLKKQKIYLLFHMLEGLLSYNFTNGQFSGAKRYSSGAGKK